MKTLKERIITATKEANSNDDPNHVKISDDREEKIYIASGSEIVPFWFDSYKNRSYHFYRHNQ